jgi:hypothetical protein
MQNKKDKRTKGVAVKATSDAGKTVASGSADAKKGVTVKGDARKGWKK